jgi:hypothetical protein
VRVEEAVALADSLLKPVLADTITVDSMVARKHIPSSPPCSKPVPVHFLYWTAWADSSGRVSFRDDLYGLEARLDAVLTNARPGRSTRAQSRSRASRHCCAAGSEGARGRGSRRERGSAAQAVSKAFVNTRQPEMKTPNTFRGPKR